MKINYIHNISLLLALAAAMPVITGCDNRDIGDDPEAFGADALRVEANVANTRPARSYQAEGTVTDGTYNLTFPTTVTDQYNVGEVNFGVSTENPQIGYVTLPGTLPLKWLAVGGGSTPTLYLDNIPRTIPGATNQPVITFTGADNPYVAAPFDSIDGNNDLLWSAQMFSRNSGTLHFDLQHSMARVKLMITADNTNGVIDLTNATVKITNLNPTPLSFSRLDGILNLDTENFSAYTDLTFVDPEDDDRSWIQIYEPSENMVTYQSPDFVLPPQDLLQDNNRPHLVITLENGDSFSGILPSAMLINDGSHPEPSYPVALSFLSQHVLMIRTVVTDEPPSLNFMPVYVMKWVDKGSFDEEAHQSGIYTPDEFYKLIDYYTRGNVFQLDRYGKQKEVNGEEKWYFDFWSSVVLDYDHIHGMMPVNDEAGDFTFVYNNFTILVNYGGSDEDAVPVDPTTLYNIVTGRQ